MEKAKAIFENYNKVIKKTYEDFFSSLDNEDSDKSEAEVEKLLNASILEACVKWENSSADYLDRLTPLEYFRDINDLDQLIEIFKLGAEICDESIPGALLTSLKTFGDKAEDRLLEFALNKENYSDQDKVFISLFAIKTLGEWKAVRLIEPIIEVLFTLSGDEEDKLLKEHIQEALVNIGKPSIEPVTMKLEGEESIEDSHEHLIIVLSKIGSENKSDRIYRCLKNSFLKMKIKSIGAMCLAVYGDGRAIPALRGYVEKNRGQIDKETLFDIGTAIKKLGGSADDFI